MRTLAFFKVDGQHLLRVEKHPWLKKLLEAARMASSALWGGGSRFTGHLTIAAQMDDNEGRPISGN